MKKIKFKANRVWFITLIVRYMSHIKNHHVSHLAVRGDLLHLLSWSSILSSSWQQETMPVASIQNLRFVWVRSHSPELRRKSIAVIERLGGEKKTVESMINNIFISFPCYACHSGDVDELYILALILSLLSIFSVLLFIGVINQSRLFITPWWDYCMLFNRNLLPTAHADSHSALNYIDKIFTIFFPFHLNHLSRRMWMKYSVITLQLIRFISIVVELSANDKNTVGASPIFELLILGECVGV